MAFWSYEAPCSDNIILTAAPTREALERRKDNVTRVRAFKKSDCYGSEYITRTMKVRVKGKILFSLFLK